MICLHYLCMALADFTILKFRHILLATSSYFISDVTSQLRHSPETVSAEQKPGGPWADTDHLKPPRREVVSDLEKHIFVSSGMRRRHELVVIVPFRSQM